MAYSTTADLLTGDLPLPSYISPQKFVDDAADEIDSKIGFLYATPVNINAPSVLTPVKKLLKRLNNFLATGRLLMAISASQEDERLHAYAYSLVADATASLAAIAAGEVPLDLPLADPDAADQPVTAPLHYNEDAESAVEAFYNRIANPLYIYPPFYGQPNPRNTNSEIVR